MMKMISNNMLNMSQEELVRLFEERFAKILPNGKVGYLDLRRYNHPLPDSITSICGLWVNGYKHPLPNTIKNLNNRLYLDNDYIGLPDNIYEWDITDKIIYYI